MQSNIIDVKEVSKLVCLSKSTIYRLMNQGAFPKPVKLSNNRVAWRRNEIENWLESLPESEGFDQ